MNITLSLFLLLTAALSSIAHGRQDSRHKTGQDLVKQFKEHRKHKQPLTSDQEGTTPSSLGTDKKDGYLRKKTLSDGSNAAASRLSLTEREQLVVDMKAKLQKGASGELKLKDKEKERYEKFIKRFEELQGNDARTKDIKTLAWYKQNKHSEEFMETRGLVLGKTHAEREAVADHIRTELADHEAGVRVMDDKLYEVKKHALLRYDKVNHSEMMSSTKMKIKGKVKKTKSKHTSELNHREDAGSNDNAVGTNEEAVSDGKTSEAPEPEALEATLRNDASTNSK